MCIFWNISGTTISLLHDPTLDKLVFQAQQSLHTPVLIDPLGANTMALTAEVGGGPWVWVGLDYTVRLSFKHLKSKQASKQTVKVLKEINIPCCICWKLSLQQFESHRNILLLCSSTLTSHSVRTISLGSMLKNILFSYSLVLSGNFRKTSSFIKSAFSLNLQKILWW